MTVIVDPTAILKRIAPAKKVAKLLRASRGKMSLNKAVLGQLTNNPLMDKRAMERVALRVLKDYRARYRDLLGDGLSQTQATVKAVNVSAQLVQRVQNSIVYETTQVVKETYRGELYRWLPSDAETPDPEHQLNYGKVFRLGRGEAPGDRFGCRCGMEILTDDDALFLSEELDL